MDEIPNNSIDLIVTSPPYNVNKDYGDYKDNLPFNQYLAMLKKVFLECYRVLRVGGRIAVNVANLGRKPYIPLNAHVNLMLSDIGFLLMSELIWNKKTNDNLLAATGSIAAGSVGSPAQPVQRDSHEYIILACKEDYHLTTTGKTDITVRETLAWTLGLWTIDPCRHKVHPCVFPEEIPRRLIKLYTWKEAVVLDPFCGTGTTCWIAKRLGRSYVGYEIDPIYHRIAVSKCSQRMIQL